MAGPFTARDPAPCPTAIAGTTRAAAMTSRETVSVSTRREDRPGRDMAYSVPAAARQFKPPSLREVGYSLSVRASPAWRRGTGDALAVACLVGAAHVVLLCVSGGHLWSAYARNVRVLQLDF